MPSYDYRLLILILCDTITVSKIEQYLALRQWVLASYVVLHDNRCLGTKIHQQKPGRWKHVKCAVVAVGNKNKALSHISMATDSCTNCWKCLILRTIILLLTVFKGLMQCPWMDLGPTKCGWHSYLSGQLICIDFHFSMVVHSLDYCYMCISSSIINHAFLNNYYFSTLLFFFWNFCNSTSKIIVIDAHRQI